jgi:hypothetical protein
MLIEHCLERAEMAAMEMMIDLHAADVDQPGATFLRLFEAVQGFIQIRGEKSGPWSLSAKGCNDPRCPVSVKPTA